MEYLIKKAYYEAIELFETLHQWPELGKEEFKTTELIEKELTPLGFSIRKPLNTGLIADLDRGNSVTLAFRADIDALPIQEDTQVYYQSKRTGLMHACGHDVHTAILLGLAHVLSEINLHCNVRFIFQPDEEGDGGADKMIEADAVKGVAMVLGLHVMPELTAGTVGIKHGVVHGGSRMFSIEVKGCKSHGAKPHLGCDAVHISAQLITLCQEMLSRKVNPVDGAVISFGKIQGGDSGNVLADMVNINGIVRGETIELCNQLCDVMRQVAGGLEQIWGGQININFKAGYRPLINHDIVLERVKSAAKCELVLLEKPTMTVDDFSSYLYEVPGAYLFLGSGFKNRRNAGLHTGQFQIDQECIKTGIELLTQICIE